MAEIEKIRIIDNHGHPLKVLLPGEKPDDEYDALTFENMEPSPTPLRIREDNSEFIGAWKFLYGYRHNDMSEPHVKELLALKEREMKQRGEAYPAWVLDKLGIETMFANRASMGRGLTAPRFRWISMIDALIFPLSNEGAKRSNPDYKSFYAGEERMRKRYLAEAGLASLPATFDEYLRKVVTPTLERQKRAGALGIKFEAAYLRTLDFAGADEARARRTYQQYASSRVPPAAEYKNLQDFLFRYIAREAGRIGLAVHIHACAGAGGYYKSAGTNPLLLEPVFNDPSLRKTNFVLIHGGWPFQREVTFLLGKPNVYADISAMTFVLYPRELAAGLRPWLEFMPEKVLFGSDVEPFMPHINWEETGWLCVTTGRKALGLALTGMLQDGNISREQALKIAHGVMRGNAATLYGLK